MNTRKTILVAFSLLIITAFVLSACQPVVQTVEVPVEVVRTEIVEVVTTQEVTVIETEVVEVEAGAFTTPHPILGDLKVREALAYCTNKLELIQSVYPLLAPEEQAKLVMNTFIPRASWAYAGDENITVREFDPEKGKALLDEAGWTLASEDAEARTNADGDELALKFTTTSATFRVTWASVFEQQMANCGVRVLRLHAPASWWFGDTTGLARRDYELGAFAWVGEADPGGQTLWACDMIPLPENGWEGQNGMGWCNEKADIGIKNANNTLVKDDRIKWYRDVQQAYTEDVPAIPLFNRSEVYATRADMVGFDPQAGEPYYDYNAGTWSAPGTDTLVLGLTQEPASLLGLVEDAFVAHVVAFLLGSDRDYTTLNYDFQPVHLKQLPTIENGGALNNDVEVNEGDKVVDANGDVVDLAAGVSIVNSAGEKVEYTGGPVTMKQLVVTYEYRDDLKWPDGSPLTAEDLEVSSKFVCDKDNRATASITCDKTASYVVAGLTATQTMLPGDQPVYFTRSNNGVNYVYPANRQLADGRLLKDVPAKEWATLPEIAEMPWGFGPYMVKEWVKGEKIVLETHPYWFGGAPATPNFTVAIITPENAEAQLLGGQVDVLGSETLVALTETLDAAAKEGKIAIIGKASDTWEHIDMNMWLK
jgi:ABC-type transport system substrate-binding protein